MVELPDQFVFNTFAFLIWGALVMWMCAGFTMLESGAVRTKNASMICLKNIGIYSIAGLAYFIVGYNLMYVDVGDLIGSFEFLYGPSGAEKALLDGDLGAVGSVVDNGYAVMSDWFFQMVFVATAASIVSGAIAERIKMWSFFAFTLVLTAFIYPIVGSWTWGGGWLAQEGFPGLRRLHHRPRHRGMGRPGRRDRGGPPPGQVQSRRQREVDPALQRAGW